MFPTLDYLIQYLFNIHISLPIPTLGLFIALSFFFTYHVFVAEFKRKEALGLIHPFKSKIITGQPSSVIELAINALIGFIVGFKITGALLNYAEVINDPKKFIFSAQGSLTGGLIGAAILAYWIYSDRKKEQLSKPVIVEETVHPYQLMGKITFWAGFWGVIGAKLFDGLEHFESFIYHPLIEFMSYSGYTYYGGFIFGMLSFFYIGCKYGMKLAHVSDIGAPGMLLAYAIGRIGCQLSGDGDWGIVNTHVKPGWLSWLPDWMWSFNFPHNVINQGVYIKGCTGDYCKVLEKGVYPTSFYEVVICSMLFLFLWLIRKHIVAAGLMSFLFLLLNGAERFFIEKIRVNPKYYAFGMHFSQAEFISGSMMVIGISGILYLIIKQKINHRLLIAE